MVKILKEIRNLFPAFAFIPSFHSEDIDSIRAKKKDYVKNTNYRR